MMRALRLVGMAAQAESRRLKVNAGAKVTGIAYWAVAGVFGVTAYVMLHVLGYNLAWHYLGPVWAAAIVLLVDLALAGLLAFLATRSRQPRAEIEARAVRDVALAGAAEEVFLGLAKKSAPLALLGGIALTLLRRR